MVMKITKGLGFHPSIETVGLQIFEYTTLPEATVVIVTINNLHFFVPMLVPSPETQSNFNNSLENSFTLSFESWTTDRRVNGT